MKNYIYSISAGLFLLMAFVQCKKECTSSDRCNLVPEVGPCKAIIPRFFYDQSDKKCKKFDWGGCAGVVPFETLEECEKQCHCK